MSDVSTKRSRKKTSVIDMGTILEPVADNIQLVIEDPSPDVKKRGRKPKGGKLISKVVDEVNAAAPIANVILHLKCSTKELQPSGHGTCIQDPMDYNATAPVEIMTYETTDKQRFSSYSLKHVDNMAYNNTTIKSSIYDHLDISKSDDPISIKDLNLKLKQLKLDLYKNCMDEKKAACFWCTYEYDNPSCYIPKYEMDGEICGYGSFCRPECAVGYLMKENIDDSTKFERYQLLNSIYGKIYDFKNNIKPAPNPHYLLDKFYGNLSIQEYRKLLNSDHMLMVIDKPLTRILPELHEDTDDFVASVYGGSKGNATQAGGVYKVKRQSEKPKGVSKASIVREQFGIAR